MKGKSVGNEKRDCIWGEVMLFHCRFVQSRSMAISLKSARITERSMHCCFRLILQAAENANGIKNEE